PDAGRVVTPGSQIAGHTTAVAAGGLIPGYDTRGRDDRAAREVYPGSVKRMPGAAPTGSRAPAAARSAWRGLIGLLVGAAPASGWRWRSPWHRRAAYGGLGAATLVACGASLACLGNLGNLGN